MSQYSERELLIAEWFLVYADHEEDDEETRRQVAEIRTELREKYLAQLEPVGVSRCPYTGEELRYPIDTVGLDGPFWDVRNPVRLPPPETPETFFGLAGAVQLTEDIPYFPFLARPGPEVPFVLPDVLERPDVTAVVSALLIGSHAGFAIAYFAEPGTDHERLPTVDEWGSDRAWRRTRDQGWVWDSANVDEASYDYELAPWIEQGKLRWIEPYDRSLELREGVDGCPYVGQPGHREVTRIEDLEVWWPSDPPVQDDAG